MSRKKNRALVQGTVNNIKKQVSQTQDQMRTAAAMDGFANFASKVGMNPGMDNQLSQSFYMPNLITRNRLQLEYAYRGSWICGQMIDAKAEDMTREGITITTSEGANQVDDIQAEMEKLGIWSTLEDVIKWGNLYGGCLGILQIDGQDLASPLRIETVAKGQFKGLAVYDRWMLFPDMTEIIRTGPMTGLPVYYYILNVSDIAGGIFDADIGKRQDAEQKVMQAGQRVHHSRCVRMAGIKLPYYQAITEQMWGESVVERALDRMVSFDNTTMSAANLVNQAHLRTVRIDQLREILAAGGKGEENLIKMFSYVRLLQSNEGITLLDKEDEFNANTYAFSGLSDVLIQFSQQLSGSIQVPMVRLLGQSPAGLNSTGESDLRNYYDGIRNKQNSSLREPVDNILRIVWQSKTGRPAPKDLRFTFNPLWQQSDKEKAETAEITTRTVREAYDAGLIQKKTAAKELRQNANRTGVFTNISDEEINSIEEDAYADVPLPGQQDLVNPDDEKPNEKKATDSRGIIKRFLTMFSTDNSFKEADHPRDETGEFTSGGGSKKSPVAKMTEKVSGATSKLKSAMEREKAAETKLKDLQQSDKEWWNDPEYHEAAKEYKSAVAARQKAVREGKKLHSALK